MKMMKQKICDHMTLHKINSTKFSSLISMLQATHALSLQCWDIGLDKLSNFFIKTSIAGKDVE